MDMALLIALVVLVVLALGIFVYFKFFALAYDKDGMVYQAQGGPHVCNPLHIYLPISKGSISLTSS